MRFFILLLCMIPGLASAEVYTHRGFKAGDSVHSFEWYSEDPQGEIGRPQGVARVESKVADQRAKKLMENQNRGQARRAAAKAIEPLKDKGSLTNADRDAILRFLLKKELGE